MKFISKSLLAIVISLVLMLGLASIGLADEMGGMNMGGMNMGSATQAPANQDSAKKPDTHSESQPASQNDGMANMPGMGNNQPEQHQAIPGMDPNMPGMESDGQGQAMGHGEESAPEGVNWFVVGGFLAINFLVIGTAGVLKFTKNIPAQL